MSLSIDFSEFFSNIREIEIEIPGIGEKALLNATQQLAVDADEEEPKTPNLEGHLRANKEIKVINNETTSLTFHQPYAKRWEKAKGDIDPITGKKINWSEPGVGPEYLISKMVKNKDKYLEIMGKTMEGGIK